MSEGETKNDDPIPRAARLEQEIQELKETLEGLQTLEWYEDALEDAEEFSDEKFQKELRGLYHMALETNRELKDKTIELAWILEAKRVLECVAEAEELDLFEKPEAMECPVCLEDIQRTERIHYVISCCCGKLMCKSCFDVFRQRQETLCPCCRAKYPSDEKEGAKLLIRRAEKGCNWSQCGIGNLYEEGGGVTKDLFKAAYWHRLSADQGNADAQTSLGDLFLRGEGGCQKSDLEAEKCFTLAAKQKNLIAQLQLGLLMKTSGRKLEAIQWLTLVHAELQGGIEARSIAQYHLALLFLPSDEEGSHARALYWAKMAAIAGHDKAPTLAASCLGCLDTDSFGETVVAGFDGQPEIAYWFKKGASRGCKRGEEMFQRIDSSHRKKCAQCLTPASSISGSMKRCTRCKLMRYCSAACQRAHWKAGHNLDCCDENGKTRFSLLPDAINVAIPQNF